MDLILQITKFIVYTLLLISGGLVLVGAFVPSALSGQRKATEERLTQFLSRGLILGIIIALFMQMVQWLSQFGQDAITLLWEGATGRVWLALLAGSILLSVMRSSIVRLWILLAMLLAESMNGHPAESSLMILFDFIHLAAISFWIGGVIYLYLNWRDGKEAVIYFLKQYMKPLWLSIALVTISGIALTILILPSLSYLVYTGWGQLLLIKAVAVTLAVWLGYKAKTYIQRAKGTQGTPRALLAEMLTLAIIIGIAAIITTLNTSPSARNALNEHRMGEELHYTVKLTPNAPGPNKLSVSLWTLQEEGDIEEVQLNLYAADKPKTSERVYTLSPMELEDNFEFPGFNETEYGLREMKLPYPATWNGTVQITFSSGLEREFTFTFNN